MVISFVVSLFMQLNDFPGLEDWQKLVIAIGVTTIGWMSVTLLTPRNDTATLVKFYNAIQPRGPGWEWTRKQSGALKTRARSGQTLHASLVCMILACFSVYATMYAIGQLIQDAIIVGVSVFALAAAAAAGCYLTWRKYFASDTTFTPMTAE